MESSVVSMAVDEEDRLSSLPDDILIGIVSRLPLKSAIDAALLSTRWHGLWTNLTSFHISSIKFQRLQEFFTVLNEFTKQITSPCIQSFTVNFSQRITFSDWQDSWLREICNRNIHVLTLRWHTTFIASSLKFPSFIFQTRSLISLELGSTYDWYLDHDEQIDLPNLKKLNLDLSFWQCEWLEKLIKSLPSLEDLSLQFRIKYEPRLLYINCSNQNLRRLSIDLGLGSTERTQAIINAPNLEYLDVIDPKCATFLFEVEPIMLREAKIDIFSHDHVPRDEGNRLTASFYEAISNVRSLSLDAFLLYNNTSTLFHSVISVTLRVKIMPPNIETMLSILDLCPQLNVLTLKVSGIWKGYKNRGYFPEPSQANPLRRVVKRIDIETDWSTYTKPAKSFLVFVRCLLSNARVLKRFQFRVDGPECTMLSVEQRRSQELVFFERLYKYSVASAECDVKFIGRFIEMSYEAGSKDGREFGEFCHFK